MGLYIFPKISSGYLPHMIQPINNKLTRIDRAGRDMQHCESHGKGVRKSAPKKAKYHAGVAVRNCIAGLCQANCNYSEIYKTLKAEEIPISLSLLRFETTGNVARKKGSGRPKASSCWDDHLLECTVLKDRKSRIQDLRKQNYITITRRLSNAGFVSRIC